MKHACFLALLFSLIACSGGALSAQTLAGTDGLGRVLPQQEQVGPPKKNRQVVLFYFLWQGDVSSPTSENYWDLTELSLKHPEVFQDFDHPKWGGGSGRAGRYYFWGQSIYGYYHGADYWVHLKNMQLLTDAGVDALAIDATNRLTYPQQAHALMRAMETVRKQGKVPPKIIFYTNTKSGETMQELYDNCYKEGAPYRYPDTWFYLDGKPLIIGLAEQAKGRDYESFFTIRQSQWPNEPQKIGGWPWIEFQRPQKVYVNPKGEKEIVNVSTSQHPNLTASMGGSAFYGKPGNWGRSFRNGSPGKPQKDLVHGYNVQEQWDFALKQQTPFVFVTGWNEWIAGKWHYPNNPKHALFVDQANAEYSRDMEPSLTAGLQDHYYMQLVANIRRYKGVEALPVLSQKKSVKRFEDWDEVYPAYTDYTGDVLHRNHRGAQTQPKVNYENKTGRNDFELLKVARDNKKISFYARTAKDLTPASGDNWMTLYLDTDRSHRTGWNGYDFRVVAGKKLQRYANGSWTDAASVANKVAGNQIMITIAVKKLNLDSDQLNLEFKWSDNMQQEDPLDWYINGDAAPGGRFNYVVLSH